ncbi:MAG: type IV toxin-antitoxin system AbiEi family antitoxin domain-containing protein [Candidatus Sumerlaeota bacterium]|nr:type IV toxin-antitoxin system AbiEi family antitoxin domain-containing protein [Candidatus Sumerlaeota bacterium]
MKSFPDSINEKLKSCGIMRTRDFERLGISRYYISDLCEQGILRRIGRGLYEHTDSELTGNHSLAEACKRIPHGVVCLYTALRFHNLTTQNPADIWIAIDRKARLPKVPFLPIRVVRFSGEALTAGIQASIIEGVPVKIYSPAKTVVDCFKYRNKYGRDVAIEALKDYLYNHKPFDEIWKYAKICRMTKVMMPYWEAI